MRTLFILLFVLMISEHSYSQRAVVSMMKENIAYLGVHSPIKAIIENLPCDSCFLTTDNGIIKKEEDCFFYINPSMLGEALIFVNKIVGIDTIAVDTQIIRVQTFPENSIIARVNNQTHGTVSKLQLIAQLGVFASLDIVDININYKVLNYRVFIIRKNSALFIINNEGRKFNDAVIDAFKTLQSGDEVIITGIIAVGPDNIERRLKAIELTIE